MPSTKTLSTNDRRLTDLGGGTVGGLIARRAAGHPDKSAIVTPTGSMTYAELDHAASKVAAGLTGLGLEVGDSVAILMRNRIEWIAAWAGAARGGFVCVPVNTAYKGTFLLHALQLTSARVIITEPAFLPALEEAAAELAHPVHVVCIRSSEPASAPMENDSSVPRVIEWSDLEKHAYADYSAPELNPHDVAMIALTSGTTGRSKGVVCPHQMLTVAARENVEAMETQSWDRLYTCLPLFHGAALLNITLHGIYAGATVVIGDRFSASRFWTDVKANGITMFNALGSVLPMLLAQQPRDDDRDNPVRRVFAAPAPPDVLMPFEDRFDLHIVEGYGLSEIKNVTYNPLTGRKIGSIGKPTRTTELQIQGENGQPLAPGAVGEIVYRPRASGVMYTHYLADPEATIASMRDLWWRTGDLGYADDDGFYYFVDRKKDALRRRGENISSYEVESVLLSFPGITEAAAVGTPSELGEDEVLAVIGTDNPDNLNLDALYDHCDQRLPHFMVPRYFRVLADLPRTPTGKIRKAELRSGGVTDLTWDSQAAGRKPTRVI